MERLLARLERRLGKLAIERLSLFIVGGMAIVFVLSLARPEFLNYLTLDISQVKRGQVWRLVTFIFVPENMQPIWLLFDLYWLWMLGTNLENEWGAFKFNVYYFLGMVGTALGGVLLTVIFPEYAAAGVLVGNRWLNYTLLFAFATLYPNYQILLLILPIKLKWLALLVAGFLGYACVTGGWPVRIAVIAAMLNYFLFFTPRLFSMMRGKSLEVKQAARRAQQSTRPPPETMTGIGHRECAICGAKEADGTDIRVCSCEKCGGKPRNLCLQHARNH